MANVAICVPRCHLGPPGPCFGLVARFLPFHPRPDDWLARIRTTSRKRGAGQWWESMKVGVGWKLTSSAGTGAPNDGPVFGHRTAGSTCSVFGIFLIRWCAMPHPMSCAKPQVGPARACAGRRMTGTSSRASSSRSGCKDAALPPPPPTAGGRGPIRHDGICSAEVDAPPNLTRRAVPP